MTSLLKQLNQAGQAVWLDFVDRTFLADGGLRALVAADGLTGVTSNPSIFEKAMGHGDAYDAGFHAFLGQRDASVADTYEAQAIADIAAAADDLRPVYDRLDGRDGYVSLEVSPYLADGTDDTIEEARRLWAAVDRPNLMVKVPGTRAGTPAIRQLIEAGLNINVTLLFSLGAYQAVAEAYLAGLEARVTQGLPIYRIASVASFFVSRIDAQIDKAIDARVASGDAEADALAAIRGKVAIANAKLAYDWYRGMIAGDRWQALAARGAMPQRLLWASTGTKDSAYPDTLYIDTLIGPDTVNTMPPKTMDAYRDHGTVRQTLTEEVDAARQVLAEADRLGLALDDVTTALVEDGVRQFADAADALLGAVAAKRTAFLGDRQNGMTATLPPPLAAAVDKRLEQARAAGWLRRRWARDAARLDRAAPATFAAEAALGIDISDLDAATAPMIFACGADAPPAANPGLRLGAIIGEAAIAGRDKLTVLPSAGLKPLAAWLEQLVAEPTGKQNARLIAVDPGPIGATVEDADDRLFVHLHLAGDRDDALEAELAARTEAGHPLVRITVADKLLIGQEFVRWNVAAAAAGAVLGVDPTDQPDVEDAAG